MNDALLERIAAALESIARDMKKLANPPRLAPDAPVEWREVGGYPGEITYFGIVHCAQCGGADGKHYVSCPHATTGNTL